MPEGLLMADFFGMMRAAEFVAEIPSCRSLTGASRGRDQIKWCRSIWTRAARSRPPQLLQGWSRARGFHRPV